MPTGKPGQVNLWSLLDASWTAEEGGLDAYLHRMLDNCTCHFMASGASLFLLDPEDYVFRLRVKSGSQSRVPDDAVIQPGKGIAGQSVLKRKPMLLGDPRLEPGLGEVQRRSEISSALIIPLITQESGPVGVLNLSRGEGLPPFTQKDLKKALAVGRHLALAVSNALLFKRMDDVLQEARSAQIRLKTVLECLGVGMMILDRKGVIVQRNLQFSSLAETAAEPGRPWREALTEFPEMLAEAATEIIEAALRGKKERIHTHDRATDRSWVVVGFPMRIGATIAIEETTEIDRLQRESARTKRLAEIGQMTAAIAHEIRNPLSGIIGAAQLLQHDPQDSASMGAMIEEEAKKLNELCNDFLEFARPISLSLQEVRLSEIAQNIARQHQGDFASAGVTLRLQADPDEALIHGDRRRLEQVCRNLALNALQASEPGAEVVIETRDRMLIVRDNGQGMSESDRDRLFTPFFTTKPSGTGLGLSNVLKIVDAHGASIEVDSSPGNGATFTLDFRVAA